MMFVDPRMRILEEFFQKQLNIKVKSLKFDDVKDGVNN